jgi:hypothetical protein
MRFPQYVIACRTYARSAVFPQKTYRMLEHNGLTDRLYIFVANKEEKALYEAALAGKPYAAIVVGRLGGAEAIRAICAHFPRGQRIVFMDDDLDRFFDFTKDGTFRSDSSALAKYLEDGFATLDQVGRGAFTFSFLKNKFWLKDKPFKEFRPATLAGNFFGTYNEPEMITTKFAHGDDLVRTTRYLDRDGGILVYWWAGFDTRYGKEEGGLQASGNRGKDRLKHTGDISRTIYAAEPLVRAYANPPAQEKDNPFVSMKLKHLPQLRKILEERGVSHPEYRWDTWFGGRAKKVD